MENIVLKGIRENIHKHVPLFVSIHAPQGSGKSTSSKNIKKKLESDGLKVCVMSIDDFYYPYKKMISVLEEYNHEYYKYRGLAGTHDVNLLYNCLCNLKKGLSTNIPVFNKSLHGGNGDVDRYISIKSHIDVVILEGWLIGYKPVEYVTEDLVLFNKKLKEYECIQNMFNLHYNFIALNIDHINNWKFEAENNMELDMFNEFMESYMKVYKLYDIQLRSKKSTLVLDINREVKK